MMIALVNALENNAWVLEGAVGDVRSLANPLVASEFGLRFYTSIPLATSV
jgi:hypothetical protein